MVADGAPPAAAGAEGPLHQQAAALNEQYLKVQRACVAKLAAVYRDLEVRAGWAPRRPWTWGAAPSWRIGRAWEAWPTSV